MQLYINKIKADLNPDEQLPKFTYQVADYQRPAVVKNNFSTDITLPSSPNNDSIFECSFLLDRINLNFNPSKRLEFVLYDDGGEILESGYVKLTKVNRDDKTHSYTITLFGALGNWLYNLSYDGKGEKLTLGDIDWGVNLGFIINRNTVKAAWDALRSGSVEGKWAIINFAPCYGYPSADYFDPTLLAVKTTAYSDTQFAKGTETTPDGPINGTGIPSFLSRKSDLKPWASPWENWVGIVNGAAKKLNAFEAFDFRSYLLRPVLNVYHLLKRSVESSGYKFELNTGQELYDKLRNTWVTLSTLYKINPAVTTNSLFSQKDLLSQTDTPADYFLSVVKIFGLYIGFDFYQKKITIYDRPNFFKYDNVTPITGPSPIEISPLNFENKYFDFNMKEGSGSLEKTYKEAYDKQYGRQRVDTGYQFSSESKNAIENNILTNSIDSTGQSQFYHRAIYNGNTYPSVLGNNLYWSTLRYTGWDTLGPGTVGYKYIEGNPIEVTINCPINNTDRAKDVISSVKDGKVRIYPTWEGSNSNLIIDPVPKYNCTESDGKEGDGKNILITFNGFVNPSLYAYENGTYTEVKQNLYILSDDIPPDDKYGSFAKYIGGGKNCYIDTNCTDVDKVAISLVNGYPWFSRCEYGWNGQTNKLIQYNSLDFGAPSEIYVNSCELKNSGIYNKYWEPYIRDIYNANTRVLKIKVKASSIIRGEIKECFRSFYSFENALWVLQKINNYTPGDELVDCEFVKVNDKANYKK